MMTLIYWLYTKRWLQSQGNPMAMLDHLRVFVGDDNDLMTVQRAFSLVSMYYNGNAGSFNSFSLWSQWFNDHTKKHLFCFQCNTMATLGYLGVSVQANNDLMTLRQAFILVSMYYNGNARSFESFSLWSQWFDDRTKKHLFWFQCKTIAMLGYLRVYVYDNFTLMMVHKAVVFVFLCINVAYRSDNFFVYLLMENLLKKLIRWNVA